MRKAKTVSEMTAKELEKIRKVKYFLLDMDGTIYLDTTVIDGTHEFLAEVKKQGKRIFYITNNSSKAVSQYVEKLAKMDIRSEEEDFYTSVDATVKYLDDEMPGAKLFVIGTDALKDLLRLKGFETVEKYEKEEAKRPDFVLLAFDTSLTYDKLNTACMYLQDGVKYIATHPDKVCPLDGFHSMPDAGSFMDLLECATGRRPSFIAGKPEPTMILMTILARLAVVYGWEFLVCSCLPCPLSGLSFGCASERNERKQCPALINHIMKTVLPLSMASVRIGRVRHGRARVVLVV